MRRCCIYIVIFLCMNFVSGIPQTRVVDVVINGIRDGVLVYSDKERCFTDKQVIVECVQEIRRCFFSKEDNSFICLR